MAQNKKATKKKAAISEYQLCSSDGPHFLSEHVNELLADGWQIYGFPFMASFAPDPRDNSDQGRGGGVYCQALIR